MTRILILDDVFRAPINGLQAHPINAKMLLAHARTALHTLGLSDHSALYVGGTDHADIAVDVPALMRALDLKPGEQSWYKLLGRASTPDFEAAWAEILNAPDLVLGFELPNPVFDALSRLGIPTLDLSVSPLRFGTDLFFDIRCTNAQLLNVCDAHIAPAAPLIAEVGMIRAHAYMNVEAQTKLERLGTIGVVAGQLLMDAAIVAEEGRLFEMTDASDQVEAFVRAHDTIVYQRHPVAKGPNHLPLLTRFGTPVFESNWPTYALCASDPVQSVLAISSGILDEAPWFDCAPTRLHMPLRRRDERHATQRVASSILTPGALGALLGLETQSDATHPPRLRDLFGAWGSRDRPPELDLYQPHKGEKPKGRMRPPRWERFKTRWSKKLGLD